MEDLRRRTNVKFRKGMISYLCTCLGMLVAEQLIAVGSRRTFSTYDIRVKPLPSPYRRRCASWRSCRRRPTTVITWRMRCGAPALTRSIPINPMPSSRVLPGAPANVTIGLNLLGLDNAQSCECQPPDTNAAVGDTQVVEWVNVAYEIFNKTSGAIEAGPIQGNLLWQSLGGRLLRQ